MSSVRADPLRPTVTGARRVVVKVGSSSLTGTGRRIEPPRMAALVDAVATFRRSGREVVLVSSGAIAAGMARLSEPCRPVDLAGLQTCASVGQGLLVHSYTEHFARHGIAVGQVLLGADDVIRRAHYRNAQRTLNRLLEIGAVPLVNENDTVATEELRFGDNDRLAALVAHLVRADLLVLLSDVDGLYDDHPSRPGAVVIPEVADASLVEPPRHGGGSSSEVGTGGIGTKLAAARLATSAGIAVILANATSAAGVLRGEPLGTQFAVSGRGMPTRMLWLAHAAAPRGRLTLDAGAVAAVTERHSSLLPVGIVAVDGSFVAGDPVDLCAESGDTVARGLINFDAAELPELIGRSTRELARELGSAYEREVVHRDSLVLVGRTGQPDT